MNELALMRRRLLIGAGAATLAAPAAWAAKEDEANEVGAVEDLMREHGVLRRALLVYRESARRLRRGTARLDVRAIARAAKLFRDFGEDYHERKLEEAHIFPMLRQAGGPAAGYVEMLIAQHRRGRDITDYILAVTRTGEIGAAQAKPLAHAFMTMHLIYENHAAREDAIVFQAWKKTLSPQCLREMGERFEALERQQFGEDGFEHAVREIGEIEQAIGFADLARFTAPSLPKA